MTTKNSNPRKRAVRHVELPASIPAPVRDIMQSWVNRDEQRQQRLRCESCGKREGDVEIGDCLQYGILCERCADEIVPKSFWGEQ
jgi:hypothetical protein